MLFFYSGDGDEPMHVHVERDNHVAKFGLILSGCREAADFASLKLRALRK